MLFDNIENLINFLEEVMGSKYEIIYYDAAESMTITKMSVNNISNQNVGMPLPNEISNLIESSQYTRNNFKAFITFKSENNDNIACSSFFIMNGSRIGGVLCINYNLDKHQQFYDEFVSTLNMNNFIKDHYSEISAPENGSIADSIISLTMEEISKHIDDPAESFTSNKRQEIVSSLCDKGVFNMKGAIKSVATHLKCSEASIYRYITSSEKKPNMPQF